MSDRIEFTAKLVLNEEYLALKNTIDRVWCALGCLTYDDCKDFTLWEKVELLRKESESRAAMLKIATEALEKMRCSCGDSGFPNPDCDADIAWNALADIAKYQSKTTK